MAGSATEARNHEDERGGRSVTGLHRSLTGILNKSVTGAWKKERAQKCNGGMASQSTRKYGAFLRLGFNYKVNDQPVHEWVNAILL